MDVSRLLDRLEAVESERMEILRDLIRSAAAKGAGEALEATKTEVSFDELVDVHEAARRLGVSIHWLYRRSKELPFAVQLSRSKLRFSSQGIDEFIRAKAQQRDGTGRTR